MLDQIKIASPCSADWERMEGNDRVRFCAECKKNVFNLSAMTRRDAEALLNKTNGNLCARLYRRADGTILTEDCPVGLNVKIARVRRRVGWAVAGAFSLSTAWAQQSSAVSGSVRNADGSVAAKASVLIKGDHLSSKPSPMSVVHLTQRTSRQAGTLSPPRANLSLWKSRRAVRSNW